MSYGNGIAVLRWPMEIAPDRTFALCQDISEGWAQRVKALITTRTPERVMRTSYGCTLADALFDPIGITDDPEAAVRQAIGKWLPSLEVTDVRITGKNTPEVLIEVDYKIPGGQEQTVNTLFRIAVGTND